VPYWNFAIRLGVYGFVAVLLFALRESKAHIVISDPVNPVTAAAALKLKRRPEYRCRGELYECYVLVSVCHFRSSGDVEAGVFEAGGSGLGTRLCPKGQSQQARALGGAQTVPNPLTGGGRCCGSATQPRSDGAHCSCPLIQNDFGIPDYEPVTLFRSSRVNEFVLWFRTGTDRVRFAGNGTSGGVIRSGMSSGPRQPLCVHPARHRPTNATNRRLPSSTQATDPVEMHRIRFEDIGKLPVPHRNRA
jgi:hypothetical protein